MRQPKRCALLSATALLLAIGTLATGGNALANDQRSQAGGPAAAGQEVLTPSEVERSTELGMAVLNDSLARHSREAALAAMTGPAAADGEARKSASATSRNRAAAGYGSITGVVRTAGTGGLVSGACVRPTFAGSQFAAGPDACTDAVGRYTLTIPAGRYDLFFSAPGRAQEAALGVRVAGGGSATVDASMPVEAVISGVATDSVTGSVLPSVCVSVYESSADGYSLLQPVCTDPDGRYRIGGLPAGSYALLFDSQSEHLDEYWPDAETLGEATFFDLAAGSAVTRDVALQRGASIQGQVEASPDTGVCIDVFSAGDQQRAGGTCVAAGTTYTVGGLRPGAYLVQFRPQGPFIGEWYEDASSAEAATPVVVTGTSTTTNVDATLSPGRTIRGSVAGPDGLIRYSCPVSVYSAAGSFLTTACTDEQGRYQTSGLPAGDYRLQFTYYSASGPISEWYDDKISIETADVVTVGAQDVHGIDAFIDKKVAADGAMVRGSVSLADGGNPRAQDTCAYIVSGGPFQSSCGSSDGGYAFGGLAPGVYAVSVIAQGAYIPELLHVTVPAAGVVVRDVVLQPGAVIKGRLTNPEGAPLHQACVRTEPMVNAFVTRCNFLVNGRYSTLGLPPGDYRVRYAPSYGGRYAGGFHTLAGPATPEFAAAAVVAVGASDVAGVDEVLVRGGRLSGTVTYPADVDPGTTVYVYASAVGPGGVRGENIYVGTAQGGQTWTSYEALPAGTYRIEFQPASDELRGEWFDDAPGFESADDVVIRAGELVAGLDASLARGGAQSTPAVMGDFDGDRRTDIAVYRDGQWLRQGASASYLGLKGWASVPADYDADGRVDQAAWDQASGAWHIAAVAAVVNYYGVGGDVPVPADYDGDGRADVAVFRPSTGGWFVRGQGPPTYLGVAGDVPVPADFDGDGAAELAVYRPSTGAWFIGGDAQPTYFGAPGDVPVPVDFDGDGADDVAVFRPSTGAWFVQGEAGGPTYYGAAGDVPVPGDYDGDGLIDLAVFRPAAGAWLRQGVQPQYFGGPSDRPLPISWAVWKRYFAS